jgi:hypothetical protein
MARVSTRCSPIRAVGSPGHWSSACSNPKRAWFTTAATRSALRPRAPGSPAEADITRSSSSSCRRVKDHVHRILTKSGLDSRAAIAAAWSGG